MKKLLLLSILLISSFGYSQTNIAANQNCRVTIGNDKEDRYLDYFSKIIDGDVTTGAVGASEYGGHVEVFINFDTIVRIDSVRFTINSHRNQNTNLEPKYLPLIRFYRKYPNDPSWYGGPRKQELTVVRGINTITFDYEFPEYKARPYLVQNIRIDLKQFEGKRDIKEIEIFGQGKSVTDSTGMTTSINQIKNLDRKLIRVSNLQGQVVSIDTRNTVLFLTYNDGTTEKIIKR
tara:strand:+ start:941 stop:1639 length:699 start_codon:yes stop_codon:yes gene_type:complete